MARSENLAESAERAVLGGILINCETLPPGLETLHPGDFAGAVHANIFAAMLRLHAQQEPIDMLTVQTTLSSEAPPRQGWTLYLAELTEGVPTAANVEYYAGIVRREARRRDALQVMTEAMDKVRREGADGDEVVTELVTQLGLIQQGRELTRPVTMRDLLAAELKAIEERGKREETGLPTGFVALDRVLGGMRPGNLIILAARPSMGKSALATNILEHVATRRSKTGLLFSFEMTREEQVWRILAAEARADLRRIIRGTPNPDEWDRLYRVAPDLHTDRLAIVDKPALPIAEVRSIARTYAARQQLDLVIVDYLQLMRGEGDNREQEVASISRGLKALAMELRIPVIALSQLSRAVEARSDKRPMLSDLRDSGSLEQDANVVLFVYRDDYYHDDSDEPGVAEIAIAKNRNGPTGMVKLRWSGKHTRFDSLEEDQPALPYGGSSNPGEAA